MREEKKEEKNEKRKEERKRGRKIPKAFLPFFLTKEIFLSFNICLRRKRF